jgi:hypothetical protein
MRRSRRESARSAIGTSASGSGVGAVGFDASRVSFSYVTRRVPRSLAGLVLGEAAPQPGDLVLATVESLGQHTRLHLPDGRRRQLFLGDAVVLAYGNRYAPRQFEAVVPDELAACHLVAAGGVAARVLSRHERMRAPTEVRPVGLLAGPSGRPLNLSDFALPSREEPPAQRPLTLAVVGASMDAGKTTTAAYLAHGLARAGRRVGFAKATGTGAGGDPWLLRDAGADPVLDFTDSGYSSTHLVSLAELERIATTLVCELASAQVDVILLEVADGLFQHETAALLRSLRFRALTDGCLFAAGDAMAAAGGVAWLRSEAIRSSASAACSRRRPSGVGGLRGHGPARPRQGRARGPDRGGEALRGRALAMSLPPVFEARQLFPLARLVAAGAAQAAVTVAAAFLVRRVFDHHLGGRGVLGGPGLRPLALAFAVVGIAAVLARIAERVDAERLGQDYAHRVRLAMFDHLTGVAPGALRKRGRGAILLRFMNDLTALRQWVSLGIARLVVAAIVTAGTLVALGTVNAALALTVAGVLASAAALALGLGPPLGRSVAASRRYRTRLANNVTEKLAAMAAVQVHGQAPRERRRVARQSLRLRDAMLTRSRVSGALRGMAEGTTLFATGAALLVGVHQVSSGAATVGTVVAAMTIVAVLVPQIRVIERVYEYWHAARVARRSLDSFFALPVLAEEAPDAVKLARGRGRLELDGVSLAGALEGIRAVAEPGSRVAVVGPSGGQVDPPGAGGAARRPGRRRRPARRLRPPQREAALPAPRDRRGEPGCAALARVARAQPALSGGECAAVGA